MIRKLFICLYALLAAWNAAAQDGWKSTPVSIATPWAATVTPGRVWEEYPRPQLVRKEWTNLNGLWEYAIVSKDAPAPAAFQGKILVPFCVESALSGVNKPLSPEQALWYRRSIEVPRSWAGKRIMLHFEAVDYQSEVFINGRLAVKHSGGSDPFSVDVTPHLQQNNYRFELTLKVLDPTDTGTQPRGKQSLHPRGIWYTAVSGVWQTVWMEPVSPLSFRYIHPVADIDRSQVTFHSALSGNAGKARVKVIIHKKGRVVLQEERPYQNSLTFSIPDAEWWSPDDPVIYQVAVQLVQQKKTVDSAGTYFAMRKIALGKDEQGNTRLMLNNRPVFQWGVLDQGWWPDGLLTPPSDEAMKYDMEIVKQMGFNMIRKHIKVEPARYYYHADTLGLLVWQDMPSGFLGINDPVQHVRPGAAHDWDRPRPSAAQFEAEWKSIIDHLRFFPSIVMWVPFNEGWGQYDTRRIAAWTKAYDPQRLVNAVSGWTDRQTGDCYDLHQYPGPSMEPLTKHSGRAVVLGEFGGLGWPLKGHLWDERIRNWGYRTYFSEQQLLEEYRLLLKNMLPLVARGLSAAIYTQTTDVEGEVNGLMTYDRKVIKLKDTALTALHRELLQARPARIRTLVRDFEHAASDSAQSYAVEGRPAPHAPVPVKKGDTLRASAGFHTTDAPRKVAMKFYAQGDLKIYLNGQLICDRKVLTKRHYDELDVTSYRSLIKPGRNTVVVELSNIPGSSVFDFGMYRYD